MDRHYNIKVRIGAAVGLVCVLLGGRAIFAGVFKPVPILTGKRSSPSAAVPLLKEGPCLTGAITAGPFDIHRRYGSMEGPFVSCQVKVGDLIAAGQGSMPESAVRFTENGNQPAGMTGRTAVSQSPMGIKEHPQRPRTLYWFKGLKLEVLDEAGKVMPTAEFICHFNLNAIPFDRNKIFPSGERAATDRVATCTQGQTELRFPDGYAVPAASDETWTLTFQAANRTTDLHRRLRHRATLYFVKDSDLVFPVTALSFRVPYVQVLAEGADLAGGNNARHDTCAAQRHGVIAPTSTRSSIHTDAQGRTLSGHWVVPPGVHTYSDRIETADSTFSKVDRTVRYGWVHIHPCCESASLVECDGGKTIPLYEAKMQTAFTPGLQIMHIDTVQPKTPLLIAKGKHYQMQGTYNNQTGKAIDSMISMGLYFDDPNFRKPEWSLPGYVAPNCGITSAACHSPQTPVFNLASDVPIIGQRRSVLVKTSAGNLRFTLDPALAPITATQMHRLLTAGAFNGTPMVGYRSDFFVQVDAVSKKAKGQTALKKNLAEMVRRLPLEVEPQLQGKVVHQRLALSMSRFPDEADSGQSSFCIMLGNAPQLDRKYTIFGHVGSDAESQSTLARIGERWREEHAVILSCEPI